MNQSDIEDALERGICSRCQRDCVGSGCGVTPSDATCVNRRCDWNPPTLAEQARRIMALAAPTAKGGTEVPAGWKLVLENPTPDMRKAARIWGVGPHIADTTYRAMLAASPPPPTGAAGGGSGDLGALSAGATAGPWYVEREPTDGSYGSGEDCHEGYDAFIILTEAEKHYGAPGALFNSHNSTVGCVETESNEDDFSAWDAVAKANAEFVVALVNAYRSGRLIEAPTPDLGVQGEPVAWEALRQLRADGWSVAVHNDYRLNGEAKTFWLLTHASGRWIKGEGATDDEALRIALAQIEAPTPPSGVETIRQDSEGATDE